MAERLSMLRPAFPVPTWMVGKPRLDARGGLSAALQAGCNHASATPMSQLAEQPHRNICGARNSLCNNRNVCQKLGNCNAIITRDIIATVLRYIHQKPTMQLAIGQLFSKMIEVCKYRCNSAEAKRRHELLLCVQPWRKCSLRVPKIRRP